MRKSASILAAPDMAAARLLVLTKKTHKEIAEEVGLSYATLHRRMTQPRFQAYMEQVRAEQEKELKAQTKEALKKLKYEPADGVEFLIKVLRMNPEQPTVAAQIKALELLGVMLGWLTKGAAATEDSAAAKPDVYQAEWMRKPQ